MSDHWIKGQVISQYSVTFERSKVHILAGIFRILLQV